MSLTKDNDKFKGDIRDAVAEIMAAKEDAERVSTIETLLESTQVTISELNEAVTSKEQELASASEEVVSLKDKVAELEAKAVEMLAKLDESNTNTEALEERATLAEKELASLAADKELVGRMLQLEEAKVVLSDDKRDAQGLLVRGMSDAEFASYLEERVDMREQFIKEMKATASEKESKTDGEDAAITQAAAAAATLNIETASVSLQDKYNKLGASMASSLSAAKE